MIQELVEYNRNHGLIARAGYAPKTVRWAIDITAGGQYVGVVELGDASQLGNRGIVFPKAPQLEHPELIAGGQTRCHFLIESAAVVVSWAEEDDDKNDRKHQYFLYLLEQAQDAIPELRSWLAIVGDPDTLRLIRHDLEDRKAKSTDRVTIRCDGHFLVETEAWHPWWEAFRRTLRPASGEVEIGRCLVSGKMGPISATHPKIMGLARVGGAPTGSVLVSFDKGAFSSYGLQQGANAAMTEEVAVAYQSALNALVDKSIELTGMKVVYWYQQSVPPEDDLLAFLGTSPQRSTEVRADEEARRMLTAPIEGRWSNAPSGNRYYLLLLSAVVARVMIRGWYEGTYEDLRESVGAWFSDLAITRSDGGASKDYSFFTLIRQLPIAGKDVPTPHVRALWESAVFQRAIPRAVAKMAMARIHHDVVTGDPLPTRAFAILKAFVIRQKGLVRISMENGLNPDRPEVAYQLGRLLAVLTRLQTADGSSVRAGLASRYYTAASTTPSVVFGRLIGLSEHYFNRISAEGLRQWHRNQVTEVMTRIANIPRTLTFEEQALFALGYYHQLAHRTNIQEPEGDHNDESN